MGFGAKFRAPFGMGSASGPWLIEVVCNDCGCGSLGTEDAAVKEDVALPGVCGLRRLVSPSRADWRFRVRLSSQGNDFRDGGRQPVSDFDPFFGNGRRKTSGSLGFLEELRPESGVP